MAARASGAAEAEATTANPLSGGGSGAAAAPPVAWLRDESPEALAGA
eukprot:COSAG04_NODE_8915_length_917_cov_69.792176_2_plen_46_part_01